MLVRIGTTVPATGTFVLPFLLKSKERHIQPVIRNHQKHHQNRWPADSSGRFRQDFSLMTWLSKVLKSRCLWASPDVSGRARTAWRPYGLRHAGARPGCPATRRDHGCLAEILSMKRRQRASSGPQYHFLCARTLYCGLGRLNQRRSSASAAASRATMRKTLRSTSERSRKARATGKRRP